MTQYGYPDLAMHKKFHAELIAQAGRMVEKLKNGKTVSPAGVAAFLKDWINNHILGTDKLYGQFIAAVRRPLIPCRRQILNFCHNPSHWASTCRDGRFSVSGRVKFQFEGSDKMDTKDYFEMDRGNVARYFYLATVLAILAIAIWFFGAGLVLALIYAATFGPWLSRAQAAALRIGSMASPSVSTRAYSSSNANPSPSTASPMSSSTRAPSCGFARSGVWTSRPPVPEPRTGLRVASTVSSIPNPSATNSSPPATRPSAPNPFMESDNRMGWSQWQTRSDGE